MDAEGINFANLPSVCFGCANEEGERSYACYDLTEKQKWRKKSPADNINYRFAVSQFASHRATLISQRDYKLETRGVKRRKANLKCLLRSEGEEEIDIVIAQ